MTENKEVKPAESISEEKEVKPSMTENKEIKPAESISEEKEVKPSMTENKEVKPAESISELTEVKPSMTENKEVKPAECISELTEVTPSKEHNADIYGEVKPKVHYFSYDNPWLEWTGVPSSKPWQLSKFILWNEDFSNIPESEQELDKSLPVRKPNLDEFKESPERGIRTLWIGHATVLVQFDGFTVLTDPIFSERCGGIKSDFVPDIVAPKRYRPTPCKIEDLPNIDAVLISHNHYDHLDVDSVRKLQEKYGKTLRWYVPMKLKSWLEKEKCENVVELSWWDEKTDDINEKKVTFVCLPCQHWSKRGMFDTNRTLWCSWAVIGPRHKFYFAGDTGYCPVFKTIGKKYGKFSLAAIPIGACEPREFMKAQHVNPEEAIKIHQDVKAERSLGIHWGTFKLTYEPYMEPKEKIAVILKQKGFMEEFFTLDHGQVEVIKCLDAP